MKIYLSFILILLFINCFSLAQLCEKSFSEVIRQVSHVTFSDTLNSPVVRTKTTTASEFMSFVEKVEPDQNLNMIYQFSIQTLLSFHSLWFDPQFLILTREKDEIIQAIRELKEYQKTNQEELYNDFIEAYREQYDSNQLIEEIPQDIKDYYREKYRIQWRKKLISSIENSATQKFYKEKARREKETLNAMQKKLHENQLAMVQTLYKIRSGYLEGIRYLQYLAQEGHVSAKEHLKDIDQMEQDLKSNLRLDDDVSIRINSVHSMSSVYAIKKWLNQSLHQVTL